MLAFELLIIKTVFHSAVQHTIHSRPRAQFNTEHHRPITYASLLACCLSTFLMSCASGPIFEAVEPPTEAEALVYLYRPQSGPMLRSTTVEINGETVCDLASKEYTWLRLKPGRYSVTAKWGLDLQIPMKMIPLTIEPGKTIYIRIEATKRLALVIVPSYIVSVQHTEMTLQPIPHSRQELDETTYVVPATDGPLPFQD